MRVRASPVVLAIFGAAALLAAFVVTRVVSARRDLPPGEDLPAKGIARLAPELPAAGGGWVGGRVRAEAGEIPAGTAVFAQRAGGAKEAPARADASPDGRYRLALPAGEYRVWAAPEGAADARARPAFARIVAGETAILDLDVAPAPAVAILVVEPDGAPSRGAVVTIARAGDAKLAIATSAGEDGRIGVASEMGIGGTPVEVRAHNGGRAGAWIGTLPEAGTVTVRLAPAGNVEGVVVARGGSRPAGFVLTVASQPAPQAWRTVGEHRFTGDRFAVPDLPPEPLRLTVKTDDGRAGSVEVRPSAGQTATVEIPLSGDRPREPRDRNGSPHP